MTSHMRKYNYDSNGILCGADKLKETDLSAGYWLKGAHGILANPGKYKDNPGGHALLAAESAINHWKNAAYAMANEVYNYEQAAKRAVEALRFLADNPRPNGGEERFNALHLYQLIDELEGK